MRSDSLKHQGLRNQLAEELRSKGVSDERVLRAIQKVPRHWFLDSSFEDYAYQDKAFPIASGQTISQPLTVALQSQWLEATPGMKVLEIGTGSGYQCAVLCEMGLKVHSIERQKELFDSASVLLKSMGYRPTLKFGDGYQGLPTYAPFDRILVTAAALDVPQTLLAQLKIGGRLIIPVGGEGAQRMQMLVRQSATEFDRSEHGNFRFVPMLEGKANAQ